MKNAVGFLFLELHILLLKKFDMLPTFKKGGKKHNHKGLLNSKAWELVEKLVQGFISCLSSINLWTEFAMAHH